MIAVEIGSFGADPDRDEAAGDGRRRVPDTARPAQIEVGRARRQALEAFEAGSAWSLLIGNRAVLTALERKHS